MLEVAGMDRCKVLNPAQLILPPPSPSYSHEPLNVFAVIERREPLTREFKLLLQFTRRRSEDGVQECNIISDQEGLGSYPITTFSLEPGAPSAYRWQHQSLIDPVVFL